jgi:hypothetical protein
MTKDLFGDDYLQGVEKELRKNTCYPDIPE